TIVGDYVSEEQIGVLEKPVSVTEYDVLGDYTLEEEVVVTEKPVPPPKIGFETYVIVGDYYVADEVVATEKPAPPPPVKKVEFPLWLLLLAFLSLLLLLARKREKK
ncbi:MAG: hypothetical protein QN229_07410, partial [Desulfurococcaceae archaeon TW002]